MKNYLRIITTITLGLILFTGCSSDDNTNSGDQSQYEFAGDPHTYDINISGGPYDGQNFSGEIQNDLIVTELALANYSAYMHVWDTNEKRISLHIFNEDMIIGGTFLYENESTNNFGNGIEFSKLSFQMELDDVIKYTSFDGTIELSDVAFTDSVGENEVYSGLAAYKITFDGAFRDAIDGSEVEIKGSVKVNFPENIDQY